MGFLPASAWIMILACAFFGGGTRAALAAAPAPAAATFRYRTQGDPRSLDWSVAHSVREFDPIYNLMEGLVELDENLRPRPLLADRWEVSQDGRVYTFTLKHGVLWTDGKALAANDFVTAWRRLLASREKNPNAKLLFDIDGAEEFHRGRLKDFRKVGVEAIDARTLRVRLRAPAIHFLSVLASLGTFPMREDLLKKSPRGWTELANLVTLGPYRLVQWERGKRLVYERNERYHGARPWLERVEALIESNDEKARELLAGGAIDLLFGVHNEDIARFVAEGRKGVTLRLFDYLDTAYLGFNVRSGSMRDPALRRAVARALDREELRVGLGGGQVAAESFIPKGLVGFDASVSLPKSIEQAKLALGESEFRAPARVPKIRVAGRSGVLFRAARAVAAALARDLGVATEAVELSEGKELSDLGDSAYDLFVEHWKASYPDAQSFMELFLSTAAATNGTYWSSERYDALVARGRAGLDMMARVGAYTEAQKYLLQEAAVVAPLFFRKLAVLVKERVLDVRINPLNQFFFRSIKMAESPAR